MDKETHQTELIDRPIKELLQIVLDNSKCFELGLCLWIYILRCNGLILVTEKATLYQYIQNNRPNKYSSFNAYIHKNEGHYWTPGKISYRIKWLKKHIKLNS